MLELTTKTLQSIKIAFHAIFILIIGIQLHSTAFHALPSDWLFFFTSDAIENLACAFIAYALYYYVFRLKHLWKKICAIFLFILLLLSIALLKDFRIHTFIEPGQIFEYFTSFLGQSLLFYAAIYFINRLSYLNRYKKLEKELNLAKEQLLRNQLHPHFLFNAFNSLYSLSLKNHPETSEYILKLSSMMRYITDETHRSRVPLAKEIDFIHQYIAIEKIRFGEDARIQFTVEDDTTEEKWIAPFLLITLVENAFKHGFYTNAKNAFVTIKISIKNKELSCIVANSLFEKQHFQPQKRNGKGLENLKQRLQLLYSKKYKLSSYASENNYTTQLTLTLS